MKSLQILLAVSLAIFLSSCDPQCKFNRYIVNNSSDTLHLSIRNSHHWWGDTAFLIGPGRTDTIYHESHVGTKENCYRKIEEDSAGIEFSVSSGRKILKEIRLSANWETLPPKGKWDMEERFTITDGDIQ